MNQLSRSHRLATKILIGLSILLLSVSCSRTSDDNTLRVGMELSYPPFEMTDERNRPTGVSVDLAMALGERLGQDVKIENIPFAGLIPALKTGKIDLIISSMTATEERAQSIGFSKPYLTTGLCLLVSKNSDINSIEDLDRSGKQVAVKQGTTGHVYGTGNLKAAELLLFEKESAAVLEVAQNKVDAFIYDQMSTYMNWLKHQETTRPILEPFKREHWAIGLRINDEALKREVNAFIDAFKDSGGFDRLGDKYLAEQKAAFRKLGYPFFF